MNSDVSLAHPDLQSSVKPLEITKNEHGRCAAPPQFRILDWHKGYAKAASHCQEEWSGRIGVRKWKKPRMGWMDDESNRRQMEGDPWLMVALADFVAMPDR